MKPPDITTLWLQTFVFAVALYGFSVVYSVLYLGELSFVGLSESVAFTSGILIGCSFALSGLSFFLDVFDTKLKYRKMLGITGYFCALTYSISLFFRDTDRYWTNLSSSLKDIDVLLGLGAMAILTFMALISSNWAVKMFGKNWRTLLRAGYIAYLLLIIRAFYLEEAIWTQWFLSRNSLAPPRLVLTFFALLVLYLRVFLEFGIRLKKKNPPTPVPVSTASAPAVENAQLNTAGQSVA